MKPKSPDPSPSPSPSAKVQLQEVKVQIQDVNIANTTKRERIEFYPILNAWWMKINTCARMRFVFEGNWIKGNLISKLSRKSNMKSQDPASRSIYPDGRTRGGHAPKRVASRHYQAAETRPKPRFRGNLALSIYQFSWRSLSGTLSPSAPINIPAGAAERASREN